MSTDVELLVQNTAQRIDILLLDATGNPADATTGPDLTVIDRSGAIRHRDTFPTFALSGTLTVGAGSTQVVGTGTKFNDELEPGDSITFGAQTRIVASIQSDTALLLTLTHPGATGATATKATRIVHPGVGQYYILWGDPAAPANVPTQTETSIPGDLIFQWTATVGGGNESFTDIRVAKVASAASMLLLPYFRFMIDKAVKPVLTTSQRPVNLGYTNGQLLMCLENGLTLINNYQPYPVWSSLDAFPGELHRELLLEAALFAGLTAQTIFAAETDIDSYNDNGHSFTIVHHPKLAAMLQFLAARLDAQVPAVKKMYVNSGTVRTEVGPNFRLALLINAGPAGMVVRNLFAAP